MGGMIELICECGSDPETGCKKTLHMEPQEFVRLEKSYDRQNTAWLVSKGCADPPAGAIVEQGDDWLLILVDMAALCGGGLSA